MQALPIEPIVSVPRVAAGNLRRSAIMSAVVGIAATIALAFDGHLAMGLFGCFGLGLGALNTRLVQLSVVRYAASELSNKKAQFTRSVLGRLAWVTILALGCALLVRPDGYGVFAGLAFFQMLMLGGSIIPVYRQLHS